jgi:hypothetical protein
MCGCACVSSAVEPTPEARNWTTNSGRRPARLSRLHLGLASAAGACVPVHIHVRAHVLESPVGIRDHGCLESTHVALGTLGSLWRAASGHGSPAMQLSACAFGKAPCGFQSRVLTQGRGTVGNDCSICLATGCWASPGPAGRCARKTSRSPTPASRSPRPRPRRTPSNLQGRPGQAALLPLPWRRTRRRHPRETISQHRPTDAGPKGLPGEHEA